METSMVLSIVYVTLLGLLALVMPFTEYGKKKMELPNNAARNVMGWGRLFTVIAVLVSWSINQSIWWTIVHGSLGWIYLIYYWLGYGR